jgi:transcriptional regulator with XRE-family HTH domain
MTVGEKIEQLPKDKWLQQKALATDVGVDQHNYKKVENSKCEPSVAVLQKLFVLRGVTVDGLLNPDDRKQPTPVTLENWTVSEKLRLVEQLEEENKTVINKMLDTMLTKKKLQDLFQQNISVK